MSEVEVNIDYDSIKKYEEAIKQKLEDSMARRENGLLREYYNYKKYHPEGKNGGGDK